MNLDLNTSLHSNVEILTMGRMFVGVIYFHRVTFALILMLSCIGHDILYYQLPILMFPH